MGHSKEIAFEQGCYGMHISQEAEANTMTTHITPHCIYLNVISVKDVIKRVVKLNPRTVNVKNVR